MLVPSILRPKSKIFLLGEAPGQQEALVGQPFIGASGQELRRILSDAELSLNDCSYGNLFTEHPEDNKLSVWAVEKSVYLGKLHAAGNYIPPPAPGLFIDPDRFIPEMARVREEIFEVQPNIIVPLGATALWGLTHQQGIGKHRGYVSTVTIKGQVFKILPTYHPAAVFRDYSLRVVIVADLLKAKGESEFPDLRRTSRAIYVAESLQDVELFEKLYASLIASPAPATVDVETVRGKQIDVVGFGFSPKVALSIPLFNRYDKQEKNLHTFEEELRILRWIKAFMEGPKEKIFQNGAYDVQYFLHHGIRVNAWRHDTMLIHHALWSQLPKGLEFLGATYVNDMAWKDMRPHGSGEELKRNE